MAKRQFPNFNFGILLGLVVGFFTSMVVYESNPASAKLTILVAGVAALTTTCLVWLMNRK